jgi:TRAP transporter 4TM/12TM fusion protein
VAFSSFISTIKTILGVAWLAGQIYIIYYPMTPLIQRPIHLLLALSLVILWIPLKSQRFSEWTSRVIDLVLLVGVVVTAIYYLESATRLTQRMEGIDDILMQDVIFGIILVLIMMECVRRVVGWSLLGVILVFLAYAFVGSWFPGWLRFGGFGLAEMIETLTMTANGVLGVTTATSIQFVFYFVAFGAFYSAIGGSQLFIDIGLAAVGRHKGGAAKAAIVSSSMMGSISGSAVANVAATGVFTIPLMRKSGLDADRAAATEAIASTGGQLMPPIMGISAFVMAELLQINYGRIALAGVIPAIAFYLAIFLGTDLFSRKTGIGTMPAKKAATHAPLVPRLYLLLPPVTLITVLISGYSATYAAVMAIAACIGTAYLRRASWLSFKDLVAAIREATKQAASVAVPIASIGIIISVSIQSNLALKFSTNLIHISGGSLIGAMVFIIIGCIIMGMGLPTVAAYIIGAILFVPALLNLGIPELAAHFFVMYYCVLSMITPPVALASYTAAGMANSNTMKTSLLAFWMSIVSFFIPFAFAFDQALLGIGSPLQIALAFLSLSAATGSWTVALAGYLGVKLNPIERLLFAAAAIAVIFSPTGQFIWGIGTVGIVILCSWCLVLKPKLIRRQNTKMQPDTS